jgi:NitT/TauT family transport system substrate-binding protein
MWICNGSTIPPRWMRSPPASWMAISLPMAMVCPSAPMGTKNVLILLTDYSSGNDQILAKPGITSVKQLAGQKVGIEVGLGRPSAAGACVDRQRHVAEFRDAGEYGNQQHAAGAGIGLGGRHRRVAADRRSGAPRSCRVRVPIYTSAQAPGLIFDGLAVSPESLKERPQDWAKVIEVWYRVLAYLNNPATRPDALKIMAARDGVTPQIYQRYVKGTHLLSSGGGERSVRQIRCAALDLWLGCKCRCLQRAQRRL